MSDSSAASSGAPAAPSGARHRHVHPLHPWRAGPLADDPNGLAFVRPTSHSEVWRRTGTARCEVRSDALTLAPPLRAALCAWVTLARLTPPHLQALLDEAAAARVAGPGTPPAGSLGELADLAGPGALEPLDDPMPGIVSGVLHRALAGPDATFFDLVDHLCRLPPPRGETAVRACVDLQLRARAGLVTMALRFADRLPPAAGEALRIAHQQGREVFALWRASSTVEVPVVDADGQPLAMRLPTGTPPPLAESAGRMLTSLARQTARAAALVGLPEPRLAGVVPALLAELHDGLLGLLLNRFSGAATPHPAALRQSLVPAGYTPTRARWCREVTIGGEPFRDRLHRFFAAPCATLVLPRTGRTVVVWRSGTCPFPDLGTMAAVDDPGHPAWLPPGAAAPC